MLTLIFDIDGTLTDMWPVERAVLVALIPKDKQATLDALRSAGINDLYILYRKSTRARLGKLAFRNLYREKFDELKTAGLLPNIREYKSVAFIRQNPTAYTYVYATGGLKTEAEFILEKLGIKDIFSLDKSTSKDTCRFSKATGMPFARIKRQLGECCLITDNLTDVMGADRAKIQTIRINPATKLSRSQIQARCLAQSPL